MRRRSVVWSRLALDDLKEIVAHIAEDSPAAARRVAAAIRTSGRNLGQHASGRPGRVSGTSEKVVRRLPWIIAYEIRTSSDGPEWIEILRVIHGARDWPEGRWPRD